MNHTMPDWTAVSSDPNDPRAVAMAKKWLESIRRIHTSGKPLDLILERVSGRKVLDIGICEHDERYIRDPGWKHNRIRERASEVLGIDILESLVEKLAEAGYRVQVADATSDADLGERFEAVVIGDVIEHVNDPVALLAFAARHLVDDGEILVSTPNPFARRVVKRVMREGTFIANLDHLFWVTPSQAMELARRAGLELFEYGCFIHSRRIQRARFLRRPPSEAYTDDYLYCFRRRPAQA
jgi:2-polyprenyl-3-methyl-5-hydroxy-6-metoxy-1,4-benzoquinol methylase